MTELFIAVVAAVVLAAAILGILAGCGYDITGNCEHSDCNTCPFPKCEKKRR